MIFSVTNSSKQPVKMFAIDPRHISSVFPFPVWQSKWQTST